jgi:aspartate/tyrosine/aromatic aminotransferase
MHHQIAERVGVKGLSTYRYYEKSKKALNIEGMISDLENMDKPSVILMQACAHNPTGFDPSPSEWDAIMKVFIKKQHFPVFDLAYQGLASGSLSQDAYAVRKFADAGIQMVVTQTLSDNACAIGERIGATHFLCSDAPTATKVLSQIKLQVRRSYTACPLHGGRIIARIVDNPNYFAMWKQDIKEMSTRLTKVRIGLCEKFLDLNTPGKWDFLLRQKGFYSALGLTGTQIH